MQQRTSTYERATAGLAQLHDCHVKFDADLLPLPADLALVLLHSDIRVHTLAADQLKMAVAAIGLFLLKGIHDSKVLFGTPTTDSWLIS